MTVLIGGHPIDHISTLPKVLWDYNYTPMPSPDADLLIAMRK
jgi:hypothetical protein